MIDSLNCGSMAINRSMQGFNHTATKIANSNQDPIQNAADLLSNKELAKAGCKIIERENEAFKSLLDIKV